MISYLDEVESLNNQITRTKKSCTIRGGLANDPNFRKVLKTLFRHNYSFMPPVRDGDDWVLTMWPSGDLEPEDILPVLKMFLTVLLFIILGIIWLNT